MTDQDAAPAHEWLERLDGSRLAYVRLDGRSPTLVFLGGFRSDMTGTKATFLEAVAREQGFAFLRFDYFGHGASDGAFVDGTIGRWKADALAVVDELTNGPLLLVGSSMGGWLALLVALERRERVRGVVGVAAAPDFTEELATGRLEWQRALADKGVFEIPAGPGEPPYVITRELIEEGRRHLLLARPIDLGVPVRLLHGMRDEGVPWRRALAIADALVTEDVVVTLVGDGDHRMSHDTDLRRLRAAVLELAGLAGAGP